MMWIKTKHRLPDKDYMAVVADGRHVNCAGWTDRDGWALDREDKAFGITPNALTHWTALPAPPAQARPKA
jgi:hypothetical protein